jgi:penicillin-binding protein 1A
MEQDKVISHEQAEQARQTPLGLHLAQPETSVAPWFQEEVRRELEKRFGTEQVHEAGLKVQTTLDLDLQRTANRAVEDGLAAYERRQGWAGRDKPGKLENVLAEGSTLEDYRHPDWALKSHPGDYVHALVTSVLPLEIHARIGPPSQDPAHPDPAHLDRDEVVLLPNDWQWTGARHGDDLVKAGDIIYIHLADAMAGSARRATLEQDSGAQGALMAMDNTTGDVLAMVGGRDYALSQFNRATQAERQTGSSFKPYVYAAAIEDGAKPSDIVVDGPVSFGSYTPHNYEGDYKGAMTLTNAFAESRNIPALKLAARVGIHKVIDMTHRFGVTSNIPAYLPIAIGAVEISLQEQLASYAVFPNDGLRVSPRLIRKVSNADGVTLWEDNPEVTEVIDQHTARAMMILLQAVTQHGTGIAAAQLNHPLGGKTGTTSDYTDAWFLGFSPSITCGVWVGYDDRQSLGDKETGAKAALPIWMAVMRQAIVGKDDEKFLSDENGEPAQRSSPLLQAVTHAPAVSAPAGNPAKPKLLANPSVPAKATVSVAKHATAPAPNPANMVTEAAFTTRPQVKAALIPRLAPATVQTTVQSAVRPALETARP